MGIDIEPDSRLDQDLELDSLELAELSSALEEELGSDPYTEGVIPETVGELLAFYA
jgi:acyl carrier protein